MTHKVSLIAIALCLATLSARAAPVVEVVPTIDGLSGPCGFGDEEVTLVVSENDRQITKLDYCSSYGNSSARVVSDRLGRNYIAVEYGEGRGTLAVTTHLLIYYLDGTYLHEIARMPISWTTGFNGNWTFEYSFDQLSAGGLQVTFRRVGNGEGDECCTLPERTLVLTVGAP
jgi:hypothetical protein